MFSNILNNEILICILLLIIISYLQPLQKNINIQQTSESNESNKSNESNESNEVNESNESNEANESNKLKIILYFAHWCGHCKNFLPIWNEFKKNNTNSHLEISEVDCEADNEICNNNNIKGFPTVILYKNNQSHEFNDERSISALNTFINKFI